MDLMTLATIKSFLGQLAEKSESVYWLADPELTQPAYISPAYEKIWGRSRQAFYNDPQIWITHLHPEDQNRHPILEMKENVARLGSQARFNENYRILRPDGEMRWIIDRGFPVCNESGKIIAIMGVAVDGGVIGKTDYDFFRKNQEGILRHHDKSVIKDGVLKTLEEKVNLVSRENLLYSVVTSTLRDQNNSIAAKAICKAKSEFIALSRRQTECLFYLVKGMTIKQIAKVLNLSPRTVEQHVDHIKSKWNCRYRYELISKALQIDSIRERL